MIESLVALSLALVAKTVTFGIAAFSVYRVGHYYDRQNDMDWKKYYDLIETQPTAAAIYFGARIVAFCLLGATIYG